MLVLILMGFICCSTIESVEEEISDFVQDVMSCADIPGLTLSVVKEGQDFMAAGFGVSELDNMTPVTNQTLFLLASVTKAMTGNQMHCKKRIKCTMYRYVAYVLQPYITGVTAAIALAQSEDNLTWRDSVHDFLESRGVDFFFNDSLRTDLVNLRDLFGHRYSYIYISMHHSRYINTKLTFIIPSCLKCSELDSPSTIPSACTATTYRKRCTACSSFRLSTTSETITSSTT